MNTFCSIRALYGTDGSHNAAHGSDSVENAQREIALLFSGADQGPDNVAQHQNNKEQERKQATEYIVPALAVTNKSEDKTCKPEEKEKIQKGQDEKESAAQDDKKATESTAAAVTEKEKGSPPSEVKEAQKIPDTTVIPNNKPNVPQDTTPPNDSKDGSDLQKPKPTDKNQPNDQGTNKKSLDKKDTDVKVASSEETTEATKNNNTGAPRQTVDEKKLADASQTAKGTADDTKEEHGSWCKDGNKSAEKLEPDDEVVDANKKDAASPSAEVEKDQPQDVKKSVLGEDARKQHESEITSKSKEQDKQPVALESTVAAISPLAAPDKEDASSPTDKPNEQTKGMGKEAEPGKAAEKDTAADNKDAAVENTDKKNDEEKSSEQKVAEPAVAKDQKTTVDAEKHVMDKVQETAKNESPANVQEIKKQEAPQIKEAIAEQKQSSNEPTKLAVEDTSTTAVDNGDKADSDQKKEIVTTKESAQSVQTQSLPVTADQKASANLSSDKAPQKTESVGNGKFTSGKKEDRWPFNKQDQQALPEKKPIEIKRQQGSSVKAALDIFNKASNAVTKAAADNKTKGFISTINKSSEKEADRSSVKPPATDGKQDAKDKTSEDTAKQDAGKDTTPADKQQHQQQPPNETETKQESKTAEPIQEKNTPVKEPVAKEIANVDTKQSSVEVEEKYNDHQQEQDKSSDMPTSKEAKEQKDQKATGDTEKTQAIEGAEAIKKEEVKKKTSKDLTDKKAKDSASKLGRPAAAAADKPATAHKSHNGSSSPSPPSSTQRQVKKPTAGHSPTLINNTAKTSVASTKKMATSSAEKPKVVRKVPSPPKKEQEESVKKTRASRRDFLARLTAPTASSARKQVHAQESVDKHSVKKPEAKATTIAVKTAKSRIVKAGDRLQSKENKDETATTPAPQPQGPRGNGTN